MAGAEARLDEAGLALWLTDWKVDLSWSWTPRRVMALVGGQPAGRIDFLVHPDGLAVSVWGMEVEPEFQRRNLALVMMDALYAAHPTAWIDHGGREPDGVRWWDRYTDPAPERNIHNQPPAEWARYFDALQVAAQRVKNAYQNRLFGSTGTVRPSTGTGSGWSRRRWSGRLPSGRPGRRVPTRRRRSCTAGFGWYFRRVCTEWCTTGSATALSGPRSCQTTSVTAGFRTTRAGTPRSTRRSRTWHTSRSSTRLPRTRSPISRSECSLRPGRTFPRTM